MRVRIVCPCGTPPLCDAARRIILALPDEPDIREWGGLTYSSRSPPVFTGQFWSSGRWEEDRNALIVIDVPRGTLASVPPFVAALRTHISEEYEAAGQPQESFWITAHPVRILWD